MERYIPIAPTHPTQATARLVIVLVSRIQKSGSGDNIFVKWKGTFRSDRPKWPDRSKTTTHTFKAGPEYTCRTKPKWSVPFDVPTEISGILGWIESAHLVFCLFLFLPFSQLGLFYGHAFRYLSRSGLKLEWTTWKETKWPRRLMGPGRELGNVIAGIRRSPQS